VNQLDGNSPAPAPSCGAGGRRMRAYVDAKGRTESGTKGVNQASPRRTAVDRRSPRVRDLVLALPMPSEAARVAAEASRAATKQQEGPHLPSSTGGVVGVAVNGVLLVGQHFTARGRAAATSWHFDNCGGHGDENGWYHYHFPSLCLLETLRLARPSLHDWWAREEPLAYWPPLAEAFPVLAYALDGVPILGPYGLDGRLMQASELDRCNGKVVRLSDGREEYRYFWTAMSPFLPPCFWGQPVALNLSSVPGGSEACDREGSSPGSTKLAAPEVGVESNSTQVWVLRSTGCPDHRFFYGDVKAAADAKFQGGLRRFEKVQRPEQSAASCRILKSNLLWPGRVEVALAGARGPVQLHVPQLAAVQAVAMEMAQVVLQMRSAGARGPVQLHVPQLAAVQAVAMEKVQAVLLIRLSGARGPAQVQLARLVAVRAVAMEKVQVVLLIRLGGARGPVLQAVLLARLSSARGPVQVHVPQLVAVEAVAKEMAQAVLAPQVPQIVYRTAYVTAVGPYGEKVDVSVYCPGDQAVTQAVLSTGCDAKAPGCSASITFRVGGLTGGEGSEAGLLSAAIQKDFKTPAQVSGGITAASLQLLQNQSGSSVAAAQDVRGSASKQRAMLCVDIFNPCAGAFASDVQAPPEYYNRYKPFSMITAVMGQPLICQVRRKPMQCKSKFVDDYNHQPINVKYQPPWNAPRNSSILRCKSSEYDTSAHLGYLLLKAESSGDVDSLSQWICSCCCLESLVSSSTKFVLFCALRLHADDQEWSPPVLRLPFGTDPLADDGF
ncbi:unnamed protein product, partial [Polarella glacialis]